MTAPRSTASTADLVALLEGLRPSFDLVQELKHCLAVADEALGRCSSAESSQVRDYLRETLEGLAP